jgi:hypothetical protein
MLLKGGYGCLYLNPHGEIVQCAEVPGWDVLPEMLPVHTIQQYIFILMSDLVTRLAVMAHLQSPQPEENHKNIKGAMSSELPLCYIHGDNRDRRQAEEIKAEYFLISQEWHIFTVWDCQSHPNPS